MALKISWRFIKKCTAHPYSFFTNDTNLTSDNPLGFRNLLKRIYNKIMKIDDQVKDEKLQYNINRVAAKISTLSSSKIEKYEYVTGK